MINFFTRETDLSKFDKSIKKITVAADDFLQIKNPSNIEIEFFKNIAETQNAERDDNIFIPQMRAKDILWDYALEHIYKNHTKLMITACRTLDEVGWFDAKYKLSPIMFLNKIGLLENSIIVGGVYLDNDDVDLMVQQNASLIITPTFDFGSGNGIMNTVMYLKRNLNVKIGIENLKYNPKGSLTYEQEILNIITNAHMCKENALTKEQLNNMTT